jgi:hypothetical protein
MWMRREGGTSLEPFSKEPNCKSKIAKCKLAIESPNHQFAICNLQFAIWITPKRPSSGLSATFSSLGRPSRKECTLRGKGLQRGVCVGFICALVLLGTIESIAAAAPQQDSPAAVSESPPLATTPEAQPANSLEVAVGAPQDEKVDSERRRKLRLAIVTGGLIGVTGLALVLLTILGGSATRRGLRRKPLKEVPLPLEPIPAARLDEREDSSEDVAAPDEDHPTRGGGAR